LPRLLLAATNPVLFAITPPPLVDEAEPNDTPKQAMRLAQPCGVDERIETNGDLDYGSFNAGMGRSIRTEFFAPRFGKELHSQVTP